MIGINGDIFYISAGETCYIFRIKNGVPEHVYFGKRVEPEDDLAALGCSATVPELDADVPLLFEEATVDEDESGKTLHIVLGDGGAVKAHLYYTPQPRGGILRRAAVQNCGEKPVRLPTIGQSMACNGVVVSDGIFAAADGDNENSGDAYGFLCVRGDGSIDLADGRISCKRQGKTAAMDGKAYYECPQLLCVYSDSGRGGMSRVFHDILREMRNDGALYERDVALFLPKLKTGDVQDAVKAAGEMGFGIVALGSEQSDDGEINVLVAACKEHGIVAGLRITANADSSSAADIAKRLTKLDIGYAMIEISSTADIAFAARAVSEIKEKCTGVRVDYGVKSQAEGVAALSCYPMGVVRNVISPLPAGDFKNRFDRATLGALGYEFDVLEASEATKRAVRAQILCYQDDALTVLRGDIYSQTENDGSCRMAVSKDKSHAYAVCDSKRGMRVKLVGLDLYDLYHVRELNGTFSGAALIHCGIRLNGGTHVLHIRQVADY